MSAKARAARVFLIASVGLLLASAVHGLYHYTLFTEQLFRTLL